MHHQHHRGIAWAFVDIVDAQRRTAARIADLAIMAGEGEIMDVGKGRIGGAQDVDGVSPLGLFY
jgi:hypothetical protein